MSETPNRAEPPGDGPSDLDAFLAAYGRLSPEDRLLFLDLARAQQLIPRRRRGPYSGNRTANLEKLAALHMTAAQIGNLRKIGMSKWAVQQALWRARKDRAKQASVDNSEVSAGEETSCSRLAKKEEC